MEKESITLSKKPKGATVINGFPGLGLVATIATGFLYEHLKCEKIGKFFWPEPPATVALHSGKVVDPVSVYYNKKFNVVIVHSIMSPAGMEFRTADLVMDVCKQVQAKELISIEGVGSQEKTDAPEAFYFASSKYATDRMRKIGVKSLSEGVIVGTTGALLLKAPEKMPMTSVFIETHSQMPDSKAAAKAVEVLDKYLGLDVPYEPLLKQAEQFESKLKGIMEQTQKTQQIKEQKDINYVG